MIAYAIALAVAFFVIIPLGVKVNESIHDFFEKDPRKKINSGSSGCANASLGCVWFVVILIILIIIAVVGAIIG